MPLPSTPLIGRAPDVHLAQDLLAQPHVRLLTLRGPGGIGKTRLALELAHHLGPTFAQGALWVDLAPIRDAAQVLPTIAAAVRASGPGVAAIVQAIGPGPLLLILDNFEHVVAAASAVGQLLALLPDLRVLVTSRTVLHLRGEHELYLNPLSLPAAAGSQGTSGAVEMFTVCAQAANPRFAMTGTNRVDVERICVLLAGIPLALELAAARLRVVTPAGLLSWLERPLEVLTAGPSDGPHHGRSLRDAIGWSYDLLTQEERQVFTACGTFIGGFTLDALTAVTDLPHPREQLIRLVEYSLVQSSDLLHEQRRGSESRWFLLEPIREFATERLKIAEDDTLRDRHATYFLHLAEGAERDVERLTPDWQARLQVEEANLSEALAWFMDRHRSREALRLVQALAPYWEGADQLQVELEWARRALALPGSHEEPKLRADVLCTRAYCEQDLQRLDTTAETLEEAAALYRRLGDEAGETHALRILASVHSGLDDFEQALSLLGQLAARFEAAGDAYLLSETLHNTAVVYMRMGQSDRARPYLERAQPLAEQTGYRNGVAFILMLRVWAGFLDGVRMMPVDLVREAWNAAQQLQMPGLSAMMLLVLASYAREAGLDRFAARLFGLAEAVRAPLGKPWTVCFIPQVRRLETELPALLGRRYDMERAAGARLDLQGLQPEIEAWLEGKSGRTGVIKPSVDSKGDLTAREQEVLRCLVQGASDKRIAQLLTISPGTVSKHVTNMLGKLGLHNRVELARWAAQNGMDGSESETELT
ncbi:LuxR family transcriptional regulator [Deinococcus aerolatus]|uniref:LuxR family transcriptional regulator n=2 Tax=Deinococcus aerolatus TaxID=522487 RepID=A0ABQ2GD00_9DEIO|nr:LuxR family transcriptional regulator [Deinococcus aerolatus]